MSYAFIDEHQDAWPVTAMCGALGVSTSGYYGWRDRDASDRQRRRDALLVEIKAIPARVKERYGSPRMHAELVDGGHDCSVRGCRCPTDRRYRGRAGSTPSQPPTPTAAGSSRSR